jgi:hypothetical protein
VEESQWIVALIAAAVIAAEGVYYRHRLRKRLKEILREHLSDPRWTWRSFEAMQRAIRADSETTKQLLFEIGAAPSEIG